MLNNRFDLNYISNSPDFDFLKSLNQDTTGEDNFFRDDSPYSNIEISCKYMDEISYVHDFKNLNNFSLLSLNIQSLTAKFAEFSEMLDNFQINKCSPDIILLQETWQLTNPQIMNIKNYHPLIYKCRTPGVQGGGVGIYIKDHLKYSILHNNSIFIDRIIETLFVEVEVTNNKKIIVASVYRPNSNHPSLTSTEQYEQFIEIFCNLLNDFSLMNKPVYLLGDFNLDILKYNLVKHVTEYVDLFFSMGFLQLITRPTRCTPKSASLIDHIVTNSRFNKFQSILLTSKISDHFPIILHLNTTKCFVSPTLIKYRNFSEENINKFKNAIRAINWNVLDDMQYTQDRYDYFSENFLTLYNISFPLLSKKLTKKPCL